MFYVETRSDSGVPWDRVPGRWETFKGAWNWAWQFSDQSGARSRVINESGEVEVEY